MKPLVQIQIILGTTPDGIWGARSQKALASASVQQLQAIQRVLGVNPDGVWGMVSQGALDRIVFAPTPLACQAWPFTVKEDGFDLVVEDIFITCFGGGFDPQDNGDTASGFNTKTMPLRGVALPMNGLDYFHLSPAEHHALDNSPIPKLPWGTQVEVTIRDVTWTPPDGVIDLGPGHQASHPGEPHALDLTPLAAAHFSPNISIPRLATTFSARGSYRILGGASYLPTA